MQQWCECLIILNKLHSKFLSWCGQFVGTLKRVYTLATSVESAPLPNSLQPGIMGAEVVSELILCFLNKLHLACRLRLTSAAALDVMPLGRRTDCGDARFAGVELAVPASNPEACVQVSKSTSRHLSLLKTSTQSRNCMCCRMPPSVVLTSLPPSCVDPPAERLELNLYSLSLVQTLCWYHQDEADRCT